LRISEPDLLDVPATVFAEVKGHGGVAFKQSS
jgi:hypothetical protein